MTIFIDAVRYRMETAGTIREDQREIRVVRKADGAYFRADDSDLGPTLLWAAVNGGMEDLPEFADAWIDEIVSTCDGAIWSYPPGVLEAWAAEFGYGPDTRPTFYGSEIEQATHEAQREAERRTWLGETAEEEAAARAEAEAATEREYAAERRRAKARARRAKARARRAKARQAHVDNALAREFGEPAPAAAYA